MSNEYDMLVALNQLPQHLKRDTAIRFISNELNENILDLAKVDWIMLAAVASKFADGPRQGYLYLGYDYYDVLTKFADLVVNGTSAHWTSFQSMCEALYETQKRIPSL